MPRLHLRAAILALALAPASRAQSGTIDQVSPYPNGSGSAGYNTVSSLVWQMQVRAGLTGTLEGFTLNCTGPAGDTLAVRIRMGAGWNTGPAVFTGTLVKPTSTNFENVFVDTTSAAILLHGNDLFVIEVQGNTGSVGLDGSYVQPPGFPLYAEPLFLGGPGCFTDCGWRIAFTTYVLGGSTIFCLGDGTQSTSCPCGNSGQPGRGCNNSGTTGGALLFTQGTTSPDTLVFTSTGELSTSPSIFLQGTLSLPTPVVFGDGVRCVGGILKGLYVHPAVNGVVSAPQAGDPSVSQRSSDLGDPIPSGATRSYQVYYRDPDPVFCSTPVGNTWNISNGRQVVW
jgi:hypothetical protein